MSNVSKGYLRVWNESGETLAKLAGKLLFRARGSSDLPAVGDWVAISSVDAGRTLVQHVLPRSSAISRKVAGSVVEEQVIAANIDTVLIVSALNHDFNLRRLERYVAMVWNSGAQPVILLNKADLCEDAKAKVVEAEFSAPGVPVHAVSAEDGWHFEALYPYVGTGRTAAFLGSSGVGKSTIINRLLGGAVQSTLPVREHDDRGRHATTARQMFALAGGGLVIDTPGMRELQLWDGEDGLEAAFDDIGRLAQECRYRDCQHQSEPGCAVQAAMHSGHLDGERLENFHKLRAESAFLNRKLDIHEALEAKARAKVLCKGVRRVIKLKNRT